MKASEALEQLQEFIAQHGDGDVALATIDGFAEFTVIQKIDQLDSPAACFAFYTDRPMTEYVEAAEEPKCG